MNAVEMFGSDSSPLGAASPEVLDVLRDAHIYSTPFIGGRFVEPIAVETFANISPINGEKINDIPSCGDADIDRAVTAAHAAFERGHWARCAPAERKEKMIRFADLIELHRDELAVLDAIDVGKPYEAAKTVDLGSTLKTVRWYGELVDKVYGEVAPTATLDVIVREPIGVVGVITPWNYPLMIAAWKFAPILAAGNSLVLKPAEQSPLSALRIAELASEAGIPDGVFNVVPGLGPTAGRALGLHPLVNGIAFTGSTQVGKKFLEYAAHSTLKSVSLELGGKSPFIIHADADVSDAVAKAAAGLFYNAGQSCNAPTRIIAHRSVVAQVTEALVEQAKVYYPGNALRLGTKVGAIVSEKQLEHVQQLVDSGISEGAAVVTGGHACLTESGGFYYEPTVFSDVTTEMRISQEEIFGPVAPVQLYDSIEEAIQVANATQYGLWANVFTSNLAIAHRLARELKAGTVAINNVFGGDITTPLGGFKESGIGRDRSIHALHKYTQTKHINFNV
jgi:acyl-CoA reductase-like NAD-dependent aldehyde dehydrogenase